MKTKNGLVIAGTHSSVGKSSISSGLMHLLMQKGYSIKPFKVGPDYIDPGHHARACGQPSYNLDTVMCTPKYVKNLFNDIMTKDDIAIIEGVMGLHDGASATSDKGSTAEVAKLLGLPVVLVIDGQAMARSSAALVLGYMDLDPKVNLVGVIANNINSAYHAEIIKDAIEQYTPAKLLGCLPTAPKISIPSRYLGLHQSIEQKQNIYQEWAKHIETHIDLKSLVKIFKLKKSYSNCKQAPQRWKTNAKPRSFNIAIARDEAFQFIYQDTLDFLDHQGFNISFFSPVHDSRLPKDMDGYYFPGGYPELHAESLSRNISIRKDIKKAGSSGKMIIGECGGLMYLGKHITNETGKKLPMVGLFDYSTSLKSRKLTLGYRKLKPAKASNKNKISILNGHEFHYSTFTVNNERPKWINSQRKKEMPLSDGFTKYNCHSFYTHIYWASNKNWLNYLMG
ncbi:MAG: cobyrinate a,c-diamide synthase [Nitrospinae bacterium]|nr:cobyrinate a,c-diamide synthase [Nitrospinota bacterium]MBL7020434.1 cobyrinate a,c-diamide synthase [Nitrospinaceae bacterium]